MEILLIILIIAVVAIVSVIIAIGDTIKKGDRGILLVFLVLCALGAGILVNQMSDPAEKLKAECAKEYIQHPERYQLRYVIENENDSTTRVVDTILILKNNEK